jgi:photosystem II stability/assembly factor-like uncharacterized protein
VGWALIDEEGCGKSLCTLVAKTTEGGVTWTPTGWIPACSLGCSRAAGQVTHLRFANADDGYAFGSGLFVTTDGGHTWRAGKGPQVTALEPSGPDILRVSYLTTGCPGPCDLRIDQSVAGSAVWHTVYGPFAGDAVQLVRQGLDDVYVAAFANTANGASYAHSVLLTSDDAGLEDQARPDPCGFVDGGEFDMVALAAAPGSVIGALCAERAGTDEFVAVSTNGGSTFSLAPPYGMFKQFDLIAMTSGSNLFVATGGVAGSGPIQYQLLSSTDGGMTWRPVETADGQTQWNYPTTGFLGFENGEVGRWVGDPTTIWQTTDGGAVWTRSPVRVWPPRS